MAIVRLDTVSEGGKNYIIKYGAVQTLVWCKFCVATEGNLQIHYSFHFNTLALNFREWFAWIGIRPLG